MTNNMKNFLEKISDDEELRKKLTAASKEDLVEIAKNLGISLTNADFESNNELDDAELEAVICGAACGCALGGGGTGNSDDFTRTCACVGYGEGFYEDWNARCICFAAGGGKASY